MTFKKAKEIAARVRKLSEDHKNALLEVFKEGTKEIFERNPDLESFSWTQYTPFFNDGDECIFSADTDWAYVVMKDGEGEDRPFVETESENPLYEKAGEDVLEFLRALDDDDFETIFGDHVEVVVTRDDIEVSEYDHD